MAKYSIKKVFDVVDDIYINTENADIKEFVVNKYDSVEKTLAIAKKSILSKFSVFRLGDDDVEFLFKFGSKWYNSKVKFKSEIVSIKERLEKMKKLGEINVVLFEEKLGRDEQYMIDTKKIIKVMKRLDEEAGVNMLIMFSVNEEKLEFTSFYVFNFIKSSESCGLKNLDGRHIVEVKYEDLEEVE